MIEERVNKMRGGREGGREVNIPIILRTTLGDSPSAGAVRSPS